MQLVIELSVPRKSMYLYVLGIVKYFSQLDTFSKKKFNFYESNCTPFQKLQSGIPLTSLLKTLSQLGDCLVWEGAPS